MLRMSYHFSRFFQSQRVRTPMALAFHDPWQILMIHDNLPWFHVRWELNKKRKSIHRMEGPGVFIDALVTMEVLWAGKCPCSPWTFWRSSYLGVLFLSFVMPLPHFDGLFLVWVALWPFPRYWPHSGHLAVCPLIDSCFLSHCEAEGLLPFSIPASSCFSSCCKRGSHQESTHCCCWLKFVITKIILLAS